LTGKLGALALALALTLPALPASAAALDDGDPGPGEKWEPGRILVRFADGAGAAERERVTRAAHVRLGDDLPLVPNLYEVETGGRVETALEHLQAQSDVLYAQPDYVDDSQPTAGPSDAAYWPDDPYFWPALFPNPDGCRASRVLDGWPFWRQGGDLTAPGAVGADLSPHPAEQRFMRTPVGAYPSHYSINVLPVWNLLRARGRLADPGAKGWTASDLRRYGVAVDDTGISDHPDLRTQVAALLTVVTSREAGDSVPRDRVREVFRDNAGRDDLDPLIDALHAAGDDKTLVQDAQRPLFALDDAGALEPDEWNPHDDDGNPLPPRGCDGHGTGVASVAAARANNATGTAGVSHNVPVVGIRVGEPWDQPGVDYARADKVREAIAAWRKWATGARRTDENDILTLELVKALRLPVLNMSYGRPSFAYRSDANDKVRPVIKRPAYAEALARVLTSGTTLGVAAAGNGAERYGRGSRARGVDLSGTRVDKSGNLSGQPAYLPCGLKLIPTMRMWTVKGDADRRDAVADKPFAAPGIDWSRLQLLCVAETVQKGRTLAESSGRGDTVVQIAAPGLVTVAARPSTLAAPDASGAYMREAGTSIAAPMVAGAAALLRRAAPGAPMDEIRRALERSARPSSDLRGLVKYGVLDVACALRTLNARKQPEWDTVDISPAADPDSHADFIRETGRCREQRSQFEEYGLTMSTARVFDSQEEEEQPFPTMQAFIDTAKLEDGVGSPSLTWQGRLIGRAWAGGRAVFPIAPGVLKPVAPPARRVYQAGLLNAGCSRPGYRISGISLRFTNVIKPSGWVFPTDAQAPTKRIQLAVALAKPWYRSVLPSTMRIRADVRCDYFPGLD
jgi:subtilisin family serine protease